jgi:hypothetical protein
MKGGENGRNSGRFVADESLFFGSATGLVMFDISLRGGVIEADVGLDP